MYIHGTDLISFCAERPTTPEPLVSGIGCEAYAGVIERWRRTSRGGTWKLTGRISGESGLWCRTQNLQGGRLRSISRIRSPPTLPGGQKPPSLRLSECIKPSPPHDWRLGLDAHQMPDARSTQSPLRCDNQKGLQILPTGPRELLLSRTTAPSQGCTWHLSSLLP